MIKLQEGCTVLPETKEELAQIIYETCQEKGWDCDLNFIDTSKITDMSCLFSDNVLSGFSLSEFCGNISKWNTSNVTDMSYMFCGAENFNGTLNNWDTSNVTNMECMFSKALSFNQPLDKWNVSQVTNMSCMFSHAESFNQHLDNWDVSNVTNMYGMFVYSNFNKSLNNWDVSNVETMASMFEYAYNFDQPLDKWDTKNVKNMAYMFNGAAAFNQNINNWDVSNVTDMSGMFNNAVFNQPLDNWYISSHTNIYEMFGDDCCFKSELPKFISFEDSKEELLKKLGLDPNDFKPEIKKFDTSNCILLDDLKNLSLSKKEKILRYLFAFSTVLNNDYTTDYSPFCDLYFSKEDFEKYYHNRKGELFSLKCGIDDLGLSYYRLSSKCYYLDCLSKEQYPNALSKVFNERDFNNIKDIVEEGSVEEYIEEEIYMTKKEANAFLDLLLDCVYKKLEQDDKTLIDAVNIVVNNDYTSSALDNQIHFLSKVNKNLPISHINDVLTTLDLIKPNQLLISSNDTNDISLCVHDLNMDNNDFNSIITKATENRVDKNIIYFDGNKFDNLLSNLGQYNHEYGVWELPTSVISTECCNNLDLCFKLSNKTAYKTLDDIDSNTPLKKEEFSKLLTDLVKKQKTDTLKSSTSIKR